MPTIGRHGQIWGLTNPQERGVSKRMSKRGPRGIIHVYKFISLPKTNIGI
jgi:hypothetical protein